MSSGRVVPCEVFDFTRCNKAMIRLGGTGPTVSADTVMTIADACHRHERPPYDRDLHLLRKLLDAVDVRPGALLHVVDINNGSPGFLPTLSMMLDILPEPPGS